jgi:hypothetical protein
MSEWELGSFGWFRRIYLVVLFDQSLIIFGVKRPLGGGDWVHWNWAGWHCDEGAVLMKRLMMIEWMWQRVRLWVGWGDGKDWIEQMLAEYDGWYDLLYVLGSVITHQWPQTYMLRAMVRVWASHAWWVQHLAVCCVVVPVVLSQATHIVIAGKHAQSCAQHTFPSVSHVVEFTEQQAHVKYWMWMHVCTELNTYHSKSESVHVQFWTRCSTCLTWSPM